MKIFYFTPYSVDKKLGEAYNDSCSLVQNEQDYICLIDADCMFMSSNYGRLIQEVVEKYGSEFDLFTSYATRIGNKYQRYNGIIDEDRDLVSLKRKVLECESRFGTQVTELKSLISGHFMLFKKSLWDEFKFPLNTHRGTILGIDNMWSQSILNAGKRIARIDGLLVVHYYRLTHGRQNKDHLL